MNLNFKQIPSPNFSDRTTVEITMIVIHNISLPPRQFGGNNIEDFFCNKLNFNKHQYFKLIKNLKVSSHLFINRQGEVVQFVDFAKKAWHAGISNYKGQSSCNDFSIGIELEGVDNIKYEQIQYDILNKILIMLIKKYPIKYIVGHDEIAPNRKTDPGTSFVWQKLLDGTINKYK